MRKRMNPILKWIGGASAALVLAFGSATLASTYLGESEAEAPTLEDAIPAEEGVTTASTDPEFVSEPVIQPIPEPKPEPKDERFVIKRVLPIDGPIKYGEWHWDDEGVPDGPLIMTVDLDARVLSVFKGGYEIGATAVLLGTQDHPTPLGTFPILQKKKDNISSIYNVPMPYTMRLTWDGIAIHGSEVENGYASHGCIGVPDPIAERLFAIATTGDKVVITDGLIRLRLVRSVSHSFAKCNSL